jgi:hypothetical protein
MRDARRETRAKKQGDARREIRSEEEERVVDKPEKNHHPPGAAGTCGTGKGGELKNVR